MMKNIFLLCVLIIDSSFGFSQNYQDWITGRNLFSCGTDNAREYSALRHILEDKRIVFLGELSHGDGSSRLEKIRLIKFLHDSLGFEVLLSESDFFNTNFAWERLKSKTEKPEAILSDLLSTSPYEIAEDDLLLSHYLDSYITVKNDLILQGVDINGMGEGQFNLLPALDTIIQEYALIANRKSLIDTVQIFTLKGKWNDPCSFQDFQKWIRKQNLRLLESTGSRIKSALREYRSITNDSLKKVRLQFYEQACDNLIGFYKYNIEYQSGLATRNTYMARNILWYLRVKYPDKKIIVSAATAHIAKMKEVKSHTKAHHDQSAVDLIADSLSNSYSIAFIRYNGIYGREYIPNLFRQPTRQIDTTGLKGSLEQYLNSFPSKYCFLDLSTNKTISFKMRSILAQNVKAQWGKIVDGLYFINTMKPLKIFAIQRNNYSPLQLPKDWLYKK